MTQSFALKVELHRGSALTPYLFDIVMDVNKGCNSTILSTQFTDDICKTSREKAKNKTNKMGTMDEGTVTISSIMTEYMVLGVEEERYVNLHQRSIGSSGTGGGKR